MISFSAAITHENDKRRVRCAGVVLVRQRPGSANGVVFITLEDETGIANIVVWPKVMEKFRKEVMGARLIEVEGVIQSCPDRVVHLVADRLFDRTPGLIGLSNDALRPYLHAESPSEEGQRLIPSDSAKARHPRQVRILPASRDFH